VKRVVYVTRAFPEPSETFVRNEIRALRREGVPVSVMTGWRSRPAAADWTAEDERLSPVTVLSERPPDLRPSLRMARAFVADALRLGPRGVARALRLCDLARRGVGAVPEDTAVFHAHFANDAAVLARYLGAQSRLPYRVTAHAYDIYQDPFLLERNLTAASRILTVSQANRDVLRARIPAAAIEVVRCGVDLEAFPYRDPVAPGGTTARLLCVARLVPKKGHAVLLDALAALRREGLETSVVLAGAGPLEAELRAYADRVGIGGAVRFRGTIPHDAVRDEMLRCDLVALPSRIARDGDRDGIPVALVEAMALGVPVVGTSLPGLDELIVPGAGRLVPEGDATALAGAIRDTLAQPHAARVAQARAGRRRIEIEFDLARIAARLHP